MLGGSLYILVVGKPPSRPSPAQKLITMLIGSLLNEVKFFNPHSTENFLCLCNMDSVLRAVDSPCRRRTVFNTEKSHLSFRRRLLT